MALYHSVKGSTNYSIAGSPNIVNGIASGFSADDYTYFLLNQFPSPITAFEICVKFTTSTLGTQMCICGATNSRGGVFIDAQGRLQFIVVDFSTGLRHTNIATTLQENTTYWAKWRFDASGIVYSYSTDGQNWTNATSPTPEYTASLGAYYKFGTSGSGDFNGSIDFNETYLKINGQAFFGVCPIEVKHIDYGTTVGYTKVGNPTITNGIISNFSGTDYVITSQVLETGQQDTFEFKTKFVKTASGTLPLFFNVGRFVCSGASGQPPYIALRNSGENQSSYGTWADFKGTAAEAFAYNTPYWVKMGHDGSYIYLDVSTDGTNYTNWISVPTKVSSGATADWVAPDVTGSPETALGFAPTNYYLHGTMDLNETSITKNGKLWFFKPTTNYLVKDGKLVFADSGLYIEESGVKTYATKDLAPVPSGFTYGDTTTSAIGFVDMRTQAFTAASAGATIGKD